MTTISKECARALYITGRARAVADMRATIRAELSKLGITSPVQLADYFAQVTREGGR
jgi:predicted chitinase